MDKNLALLEEKLTTAYTQYRSHMLYIDTKGQYNRLLLGSASVNEAKEYYYEFQSKTLIKANLMISDRANNVVLSTFQDPQEEKTIESYNKKMNAKDTVDYSVKTHVIHLPNYYSLIVLSTPLYHDNAIIGYMNYYWDLSTLLSELGHMQFDYAIYDDHNYLISISDMRLNGKNGFLWDTKKTDHTFTMNKVHYATKSTKILDGLATLCVIHATIENEHLYIIGVLLILFIGGCIIFLFSLYSSKISYNASKSVSLLTKEMMALKKSNLDYKIELHTQDEFELIGEKINEMMAEIRNLTSVNAMLHYESKISELKFLEAQFEPHFLYNTLDTIRFAMLLDIKMANKLIYNLTHILRYSINNAIENVTLQEDMEYVQMYLDIEKCRFPDNFDYTIDIETDCLQVIVPRLLLQPLIENSIKNGFQDKKALHIEIKGYMKDDLMVLQVKDNGKGMDAQTIKHIQEMLDMPVNTTGHHGLYNVYRRLYLLYGKKDAMHIESTYVHGTIITLYFHLKGEDHV